MYSVTYDGVTDEEYKTAVGLSCRTSVCRKLAVVVYKRRSAVSGEEVLTGSVFVAAISLFIGVGRDMEEISVVTGDTYSGGSGRDSEIMVFEKVSLYVV